MNEVRVVFFGTPDFAVPILDALRALAGVTVAAVVTQPDRPVGRGEKLSPSPVKQYALTHALPVFQPERIKRTLSQFIQDLESIGPVDCALVVAFGQILPEELLAFPKHGFINVHASLLPRWRGAAPMQRALMAGDPTTGVCLMRMEAGLDTGAVFSKIEVPIESQDTFGTLHEKLCDTSVLLIKRDFRAYIAGELTPVPQPSEGITYARKIDPIEALIDWTKPAGDLFNLIRAFNPIPGAYTFLNGKRVKIFQSEIKDGSRKGSPGEVVTVDAHSIEVACGVGSLRLLEMQLEGKRRIATPEFLRGFPLTRGTIVGR
jgi:methionyl-tRNA formyltransferase